MSVTEEDGGRLNAYAKEPRIEVIESGASYSWGSWLIIISGALLITGLIAFSMGLS